MKFDEPFVEYLVIGVHTATWTTLILMKIFSIPLKMLNSFDPAWLIFIVPFIYILGMLFDEISFRPLNSIRKKVLLSTFKTEPPKTEFIAFHSEQLYQAYQVRVKRLRILSAAIFNWPLLGVSILLQLNSPSQVSIISILGVSILLCLASFWAWKNLYERAYSFRKNANDIIVKNIKTTSK